MITGQDIEPAIRGEICERLKAIAHGEGVTFLLTVESGSRAWGFPSPDSDYDVRFIYLRSPRDYLSLIPIRDVIERAIVDDLDVNGWDLRKTLQLLLKQNAVVSEWLDSPIRYLPDHPGVDMLRTLANRFFDPAGYARHYASLARNNVERWEAQGKKLSAKRYFYALRPALCVRALRIDPTRRPPMRLQDLLHVCQLAPNLIAEIEELVALKAIQREAAKAARSPAIEALIVEELGRAGEITPRQNQPAFLKASDTLFRQLILDQSRT